MMKIEVYNDIIAKIRNFRGLSRDCVNMLQTLYKDIPSNTLYSILSLEIQQKMKINHTKLFGNNKNYYDSYLDAVQRGEHMGILLRMAQILDTSPALLARNVLEKYYVQKDANVSKNVIAKVFKDTTLIENKDLAYEIYLCILYDDLYGPIADAIGISIGHEYELKLQDCLIQRNIAFRNEEHLRLRGYDKTPDIKLEVPIAVNGCVINWIESKARFGNIEVHQRYMKEQFLSYWNRFGSGLVIYWFGFLEILHKSTEKKFIIMDHFPENITYMDPASIKPANNT